MTIWKIFSFLVFKVLSVLGVPGVVAVLLVGRTSFTIKSHLPVRIIYIAVHSGPEC